jgi:hypothetical protein
VSATAGEVGGRGAAVRDARGWGLVAGPVAFVAAWAVAGARTPDYSPVADAISRTAEVGAPARGLMTAGFVAFTAGVGVGSQALRAHLPGPAWVAAAVAAAGTAGVACTPLGVSPAVDVAHGVAATTGYVGLAAVPLLAAGPLRAGGRRVAAGVSVAAGAVVAAALAATVATDSLDGLAQRTGLTTGDAWLAVTGAAIALGRLRATDA